MKVLIAGMDRYLGWTLAMYLTNRGHEVVGVDTSQGEKNVEEIGSWSATPIQSMDVRLRAFKEIYGKQIEFYEGDLREYHFVKGIVQRYKPDTIVHLGEQPCAPYSMKDVEHPVFTQTNNIVGTLNFLFAMYKTSPHTHMLKLGTMGEYGTPNIDIPEGFFEIEYRGRSARNNVHRPGEIQGSNIGKKGTDNADGLLEEVVETSRNAETERLSRVSH